MNVETAACLCLVITLLGCRGEAVDDTPAAPRSTGIAQGAPGAAGVQLSAVSRPAAPKDASEEVEPTPSPQPLPPDPFLPPPPPATGGGKTGPLPKKKGMQL